MARSSGYWEVSEEVSKNKTSGYYKSCVPDAPVTFSRNYIRRRRMNGVHRNFQEAQA